MKLIRDMLPQGHLTPLLVCVIIVCAPPSPERILKERATSCAVLVVSDDRKPVVSNYDGRCMALKVATSQFDSWS